MSIVLYFPPQIDIHLLAFDDSHYSDSDNAGKVK